MPTPTFTATPVPTPIDPKAFTTKIGHVSIVVVFCVIVTALGLSQQSKPEADHGLEPARVTKQNAQRIPKAGPPCGLGESALVTSCVLSGDGGPVTLEPTVDELPSSMTVYTY